MPWLATSYPYLAGRQDVHVRPAAGRALLRRRAVRRGRGEVELRPDREPQLPRRAVASPPWSGTRVRRSSTTTPSRCTSRTRTRRSCRTSPGGTLAMLSPKTTAAQTAAADPAGAGRQRPVHGGRVRDERPRHVRPQPGVQPPGAVERPPGAAVPRPRRLEDRPRGRDPRDHAVVGRDADDLRPRVRHGRRVDSGASCRRTRSSSRTRGRFPGRPTCG